MKNLSSKVAVVTGAASGIGQALCVELARHGAHIAMCDVDEQGLHTTQSLVAGFATKATTHKVNVANRAAMEQLPAQVLADHGHIHLVINNAGVSFMDTVEHASIEDFEWLKGINFWGVVYGSKFFLPHLLREAESHLVNISSLFGFIGVPSQAGYCASKFAVRGFTESLRQEMVGRPIGITSVHPGGIDTNIVSNSRFTQGFNVSSQEELVGHFKRMAITSPAQAAQTIVEGIIKNRPRVVVGRDAKLFDWVQRVLPVRYANVFALLTPKPR